MGSLPVLLPSPSLPLGHTPPPRGFDCLHVAQFWQVTHPPPGPAAQTAPASCPCQPSAGLSKPGHHRIADTFYHSPLYLKGVGGVSSDWTLTEELSQLVSKLLSIVAQCTSHKTACLNHSYVRRSVDTEHVHMAVQHLSHPSPELLFAKLKLFPLNTDPAFPSPDSRHSALYESGHSGSLGKQNHNMCPSADGVFLFSAVQVSPMLKLPKVSSVL